MGTTIYYSSAWEEKQGKEEIQLSELTGSNCVINKDGSFNAQNSLHAVELNVIDRTGMADIGAICTYLNSTSHKPFYLRNYIATNSHNNSVLAAALDTSDTSGCNVIVGEGSNINYLHVGNSHTGVTTGDCQISVVDGGKVGSLYIGTLNESRLGTEDNKANVTVNVSGTYDSVTGYSGSSIKNIFMTDNLSNASVYADVTLNLKDTSGTSIYCGASGAKRYLEGDVSITLENATYTRLQNYYSSTSKCNGKVSVHVTGGTTSTLGTLYLDNTHSDLTIDANSCLAITSKLRDGLNAKDYTNSITIDATKTNAPVLASTTSRKSVFHSSVAGLVKKLNFSLNQEGDDNYILRKTKNDVYIEERPVLYSYAWSLFEDGEEITWQGGKYTIGTDAFGSYAAAAAAVAKLGENKPNIETADTYYSPDWSSLDAGTAISDIYGASKLTIGLDAYTSSNDAHTQTMDNTAYVIYNTHYGAMGNAYRPCDFTDVNQCIVYNSCSNTSAGWNSGIVTNRYGGTVQIINCNFTVFDGYGGKAKVDKSYTQIVDNSTIGTLYASQVSSTDTMTLQSDGTYSWNGRKAHSTVTQKILNNSSITDLYVGGYACISKGEFYIEVSKSSITNLHCSGSNNGNRTLGNISITLSDAAIGKLNGYVSNASDHHVSITVTGGLSYIGAFDNLKETDTLTIDHGATLVFDGSSDEFNQIHEYTNNGTLYLTGEDFINTETTACIDLSYLTSAQDSTIKIGTFDSSTQTFTESESIVTSIFNDTQNGKKVTYTLVTTKQSNIYICSKWMGKDVQGWYNASGEEQSTGTGYKYGVNAFSNLSQVSKQLAAGGTIVNVAPDNTPTVLAEDTTITCVKEKHGTIDAGDHPLEANGNALTLTYMDVKGNVYGGATGGTTESTYITLSGCTTTGMIIGGSNGGTANATSVNISDGSIINGFVYGGSSNGDTGRSIVTISDSTLNKGVYGGSRIAGTTDVPVTASIGAITLDVSDTTVANGRMLYGGCVVQNANVTIDSITTTLTGINTNGVPVSYYGGGNFLSGTLNITGTISTTINSGNYKNVFSGANISSSTFNANDSCIMNDVSLTINGGTFTGVVGNGSPLRGNLNGSQGASSLTITGGTFDKLVFGGAYSDGGEAISRGSTINISGGTFKDIVVGGNTSNTSAAAKGIVNGDIAITVDTSGTKEVTFERSLFSGSMGGGIINGDTSITFTGLGENLHFGSTGDNPTSPYISGDSQYARINDSGVVVSYLSEGKNSSLIFDAFTGSFGANVNNGFNKLQLTNGSKVTFTGTEKNNLTRIDEWTLQLSSAEAAIVFKGTGYKNDFTDDTIRLTFDETLLGDSSWAVFDGNGDTIKGWDALGSVTLNEEVASFEDDARKSDSYTLSLDTDANTLKLAKLAPPAP